MLFSDRNLKKLEYKFYNNYLTRENFRIAKGMRDIFKEILFLWKFLKIKDNNR